MKVNNKPGEEVGWKLREGGKRELEMNNAEHAD